MYFFINLWVLESNQGKYFFIIFYWRLKEYQEELYVYAKFKVSSVIFTFIFREKKFGYPKFPELMEIKKQNPSKWRDSLLPQQTNNNNNYNEDEKNRYVREGDYPWQMINFTKSFPPKINNIISHFSLTWTVEL